MTRKFVLITQPNCYWCNKAKELLQAKYLDYSEHMITADLRTFLFDLGLLTTPQLWLVDKFGPYHIGGYDNLESYVGAYINEHKDS